MKDDLRRGADRVTEILRQAGHEAYFAGGCVRDQLLGQPPKDYDIVTDARPGAVAALFRRTIQVGAAFGVVKVVMSGGRDYEVATFRTEGEYSDGRRPDEVAYSDDWREDVARRDFTINALLMDPKTEEILDAVGGRRDLDAQIIRAVGEPERRFEEDKLRMLRAVRFAARLRFRIEERTWAAIRAHADQLDVVSKERIVTELEGIFRADPGSGFALMRELGLIDGALPHVAPASRSQLVERMQRLTGVKADLPPAAVYAIAWALTLDGLERKVAEAALRDLKLSREAIRAALRLYDAEPDLLAEHPPTSASVMRLAAAADAEVLAAYQAALIGEHATVVDTFAWARQDLVRRPLPPRPMVTGADLKALGMAPGRTFKAIMARVDDAVLERRVETRAQALALVEALRSDLDD